MQAAQGLRTTLGGGGEEDEDGESERGDDDEQELLLVAAVLSLPQRKVEIKNLEDFRPISLIGGLYKLLVKVLAY